MSRAKAIAGSTVWIDSRTILYIRPNRMWAIRQLSGGSHEGVLYGRSIVHGRVVARGRVLSGTTMKVTRGELSASQVRSMVRSAPGYGDVKVTR